MQVARNQVDTLPCTLSRSPNCGHRRRRDAASSRYLQPHLVSASGLPAHVTMDATHTVRLLSLDYRQTLCMGCNRLTRRAAYKAVLFKLVPRAFHLNFLLSRNIQTHLEKRRGTSLCVLAERSFISSFEVSTELTIHRHALDLLPVQLQIQNGLGSETTRELYRIGCST